MKYLASYYIYIYIYILKYFGLCSLRGQSSDHPTYQLMASNTAFAYTPNSSDPWKKGSRQPWHGSETNPMGLVLLKKVEKKKPGSEKLMDQCSLCCLIQRQKQRASVMDFD